MAFRKPITTLGGLLWWKNIRQDSYFITWSRIQLRSATPAYATWRHSWNTISGCL